MGRGGAGAMGGAGDPSRPPLPNSKSVPALHHGGNTISNHHSSNKSRSINNLISNTSSSSSHTPNSSLIMSHNSNAAAADQGFYQNLSVYRAQNQSQPNLGER